MIKASTEFNKEGSVTKPTHTQKLYLANTLVSVLLFLVLLAVRYYLVLGFSRLFQLSGRFISHFSITCLDLAIIASIPLWTVAIYSKFSSVSRKTIVAVNMLALLIIIVTLFLSYLVGGHFSDTSPFAPAYVLSPPFDPYFTFSLCVGCALTFLIFRLYRKVNR